MPPPNSTYAPLQAFVDELVRCGLRHAVTCPGSRNAPLILALAERPEVDAVSVIDERSAGYLAVGMAKASGLPVAVTCTSGTAAANLHPALAEASEADAPLLVLTADRPPELRDVGAGQAIDQLDLYGRAAKWFVEVGSHPVGRASAVHHRALACRAWFTAAAGRPGPVHLNFPLREPLSPAPDACAADPATWAGRDDGRPWTTLSATSGLPRADDLAATAERLGATPRGAIVCGATAEPVAESVARLVAVLEWPVLAEPASGVRCGAHDRSRVVAHYDVLLRDERFAAAQRPELVLRVGDTPVSQPLRAWLAGTAQIVIDPHASWHEPTRRAEQLLAAQPGPTLDALASHPARQLTTRGGPAWIEAWRRADAIVPSALAAAPDPFEPKLIAALEPVLPDDAVVWLSHSMPIRDAEGFFPASDKALRFLSNRGANGIDGVVSGAAGAALATGRPTCLVTGDVALLHDVGGLVSARRAGVELTVVCLDNGGGSIFDFLPLAQHAERELYERHVVTPPGVDLESVAALGGLELREARTVAELQAAAAAPALVRVPSDRAANLALHRELVERVAAAL